MEVTCDAPNLENYELELVPKGNQKQALKTRKLTPTKPGKYSLQISNKVSQDTCTKIADFTLDCEVNQELSESGGCTPICPPAQVKTAQEVCEAPILKASVFSESLEFTLQKINADHLEAELKNSSRVIHIAPSATYEIVDFEPVLKTGADHGSWAKLGAASSHITAADQYATDVTVSFHTKNVRNCVARICV